MFMNHFHMKAQPFCEYLNVERIQRDERFVQALARLQYFSLQGCLAVITGITGLGKSTLVKLFLSSLAHSQYFTIYVHLTQVRSSSLLKLIASQLGQTPRLAKERVFAQILNKVRASDLEHILIIDEAHLVATEALTDLRLLVSSALDEAPPIKILLVGQPELKNTLSYPSLADLRHRINVRYELKAFNKTQTICYIDTHLTSVGAEPSVFTNEAKDLIFEYSHGVPRQINQLATASLLNAYSRNLHRIDEKLFLETIAEFPLQ